SSQTPQLMDKTISSDSTSFSNASSRSTVWKHFHRRPSYAPNHNVCKYCHPRKKYKITTGLSTLRAHLISKHQLEVPTKNYNLQFSVNPFDLQTQKEHTKYLLKWIICDLQPFTIIDNSYFWSFIKFLCPRYTIPKRHQIKDLVMDEFNYRQPKIIDKLSNIPEKCLLTADIWSSTVNREAFLGLTVHYIDSNWQLQNFLLDLIPFNISHSAESILQKLSEYRDKMDQLSITSTILDPYIKLSVFSTQSMQNANN
ncbi:27591_t:CDS:2, partial [Dentiscutata erythropus]